MLNKPAVDRGLLAKINQVAPDRQDRALLLCQAANQRGAHHSAMASDE
jgi:hypothetical protein